MGVSLTENQCRDLPQRLVLEDLFVMYNVTTCPLRVLLLTWPHANEPQSNPIKDHWSPHRK